MILDPLRENETNDIIGSTQLKNTKKNNQNKTNPVHSFVLHIETE